MQEKGDPMADLSIQGCVAPKQARPVLQRASACMKPEEDDEDLYEDFAASIHLGECVPPSKPPTQQRRP